MMRLILIVVVVALTLVGGIAVTLQYFFGWKGLIALPFIVLALVWVAKKIIGMVLKKFALGLFGMKSGALKGATMNIHSITPVAKPIEAEEVKQADEDEMDASDAADEEPEEEVEPEEPEEPKYYYQVDMTITPSTEARDGVWEPSEFILTSEKISSLEDLEEKEVGSVHEIQVWDGNAFGPDDPGKYPGEQRLMATFAVKPGTKTTWLHYYSEPLGQLKIPEWRV